MDAVSGPAFVILQSAAAAHVVVSCAEHFAATGRVWSLDASLFAHYAPNQPSSVYRLGEIPIQSCGRSVHAPHVGAGARSDAYIELRAKRQRSAREAIIIPKSAFYPYTRLILRPGQGGQGGILVPPHTPSRQRISLSLYNGEVGLT